MKKLVLILTLLETLGTAQQSQALYGFNWLINLIRAKPKPGEVTFRETCNAIEKAATDTTKLPYTPSGKTLKEKQKIRNTAQKDAEELVKKLLVAAGTCSDTEFSYKIPYKNMNFYYLYPQFLREFKKKKSGLRVEYVLTDANDTAQLGSRNFMIKPAKYGTFVCEPGKTEVNKDVRQQGVGTLLLLIEMELAKQYPLDIKEIQLNAFPYEHQHSLHQIKKMLPTLVKYYESLGFNIVNRHVEKPNITEYFSAEQNKKIMELTKDWPAPVPMAINVRVLKGETPPLNSFIKSKPLEAFSKDFEKPEICNQMAKTAGKKEASVNQNSQPAVLKE